MTGEQPRPAAAGKLKERPVPRLIQQIFRKRITGSLVVSDDSGDVTRVYIREGLPVHAERPNDIDRLDRLLVASGLVSEAAIADVDEEVNRTGRRLGELLVMKGKITREALAELLKTQIRRKLTRLAIDDVMILDKPFRLERLLDAFEQAFGSPSECEAL